MSEIRFGAYRIEETIGSGALSTIYKAVEDRVGRTVALKALKAQIAPTSSFGEQLDREAKILGDLVHPNVVLLLEANRNPSGRPYLVLEHVDGPSLEKVIAKATRKKPIPIAGALAIACGITSALEHVHARGIVHRDVKPSNVLLARTGVVKLIDFGIAQRPRTMSMSDALGTEGITASGRMAPEQLKDAFGTPAYMSPEQVLGDFVDGRSDLFSLGVVLYQMLSGERPFDSNQRIQRSAPTPLRSIAPHCPRAVERIVMRLLEKSPNERYPSAAALRERLEGAMRAETREEPARLVQNVLADAGVGDAPAPLAKRESVRPRAGRARPAMLPAWIGFAVIAALFTLGAVANEGTSARAHDAPGEKPLELAPERAGGVRVVATPWAEVKVDGQLLETTPFARPIPLAVGKHWVTLSHPEAPSIEREIDVVAGETVMLDVTLDVRLDAGK